MYLCTLQPVHGDEFSVSRIQINIYTAVSVVFSRPGWLIVVSNVLNVSASDNLFWQMGNGRVVITPLTREAIRS